MFESDDYDQILSQFDFPNGHNAGESGPEKPENENTSSTRYSHDVNKNNEEINPSPLRIPHSFHKIGLSTLPKHCLDSHVNITPSPILKPQEVVNKNCKEKGINNVDKVSPKHAKRKIIDSHFDYNTKRKFPGPAGLLTGSLQESKDESVCHLELFSQDVDFSQNNLKRGLFELSMWSKLKEDIVDWKLGEVDTIKGIKQQAVAGNLRMRKAQTVAAFIETVDRSATDPLIVLRDTTGNMKCTLHRDAWSLFSSYLVAEHCALVLWKPTVLTTGSAFKKHYLNITLSNIYAIFSSAILEELDVEIPDGYMKHCESDFTVLRRKEAPEILGTNHAANNDTANNEEDLMDDLESIFSDEIFS